MSELMKASVLKDKNGVAVQMTDERLPQVTADDNGMPLYASDGEYKVGKLQKNAVEGLVTDLITYGTALNEKAPENHAAADAKHGMADYEKFGHVKLIQLPLVQDDTNGNWVNPNTGEHVATADEMSLGTTGLAASAFAVSVMNELFELSFETTDRDLRDLAGGHENLLQRFNTHESNALMKSDRQGIISDALSTLAGADSSNATIAALQSRVIYLENRVTDLERQVVDLDYQVEEFTDRLFLHAGAIETLQNEVSNLEIQMLYHAYESGWPVMSPDETMYGIKVNDDGTLYTVPFVPLSE